MNGEPISTDIPDDEKLAMLKHDAVPALRSDNRALSTAIINAIRKIEDDIAGRASRPH